MEMKSFYGPSVRAAVSQAEAEWGPNAVIVTSRTTSPEMLHLGDHEVVCARGEVVSAPATECPAVSMSLASEDLRRQIDSARRSLFRLELIEHLTKLIDADVDEQLAQDLVEGAVNRLADEKTDILTALRAEIEARIPTRLTGTRIACFLGPPGVGKTTTLVKVAAVEGIRGHQPVQVLSFDTWRVAAADQLRSFCAILGIDFHVVESASQLQQAIATHVGKGLLLIDTPGISRADQPVLDELQAALATVPGVERHLVLPATIQLRDLRRVAGRFSALKPDHLVFTQIDEAATYGPAYSFAVTAALPVSYLCNGQQIPEDISQPGTAGFSELILPHRTTNNARLAA